MRIKEENLEDVQTSIDGKVNHTVTDGHLPDPVLRCCICVDRRCFTIQGTWDHGIFRLSRELAPEDDPKKIFSGGDYSVIKRLTGFFSYPQGEIIADLAKGKTNDTKRNDRIHTIRQDGVEILLSSLAEGDLRVHGKGVNEVGSFRLHGFAKPIMGCEYLYEATITKEYNRMGDVSGKNDSKNAPVRRGYTIGAAKRSSPPIAPATQMRTPPAVTPDLVQPNVISIPLAAPWQPCEEENNVGDATQVAVENLASTNQCSTSASTKAFQRNLLLLIHSSSCKQGRRCQVNSSCVQLKSLWKHISVCKQRDCEICETPNYTKYKNVLTHFKNCKNPRCSYCAPMREIERLDERRRKVRINQFLLQFEENRCRPVASPRKSSVKTLAASTQLWDRYSTYEIPAAKKMKMTQESFPLPTIPESEPAKGSIRQVSAGDYEFQAGRTHTAGEFPH